MTGQTGLHLAAERDFPEITSVLINNNIDFTAGKHIFSYMFKPFFSYLLVLRFKQRLFKK